MGASPDSGPGGSTHHPAQVLATEGRKKEGKHILSQKLCLEQENDSELYLPTEGVERTKGRKKNEKRKEKKRKETHKRYRKSDEERFNPRT